MMANNNEQPGMELSPLQPEKDNKRLPHLLHIPRDPQSSASPTGRHSLNEKASPSKSDATDEEALERPEVKLEPDSRPPTSVPEYYDSADSQKDPEIGTSSSANDDDDQNKVDWDGDDDPENPYNWPMWQVVVNCIMINLASFLAPLGSSEHHLA